MPQRTRQPQQQAEESNISAAYRGQYSALISGEDYEGRDSDATTPTYIASLEDQADEGQLEFGKRKREKAEEAKPSKLPETSSPKVNLKKMPFLSHTKGIKEDIPAEASTIHGKGIRHQQNNPGEGLASSEAAVCEAAPHPQDLDVKSNVEEPDDSIFAVADSFVHAPLPEAQLVQSVVDANDVTVSAAATSEEPEEDPDDAEDRNEVNSSEFEASA